jgi:hypothetical protein
MPTTININGVSRTVDVDVTRRSFGCCAMCSECRVKIRLRNGDRTRSVNRCGL